MVDADIPLTASGLPEPLIAALRKLAATPKLLVALDFDGTLAPEVDEPEQARALPEARDAVLRLLALPNTRVALISGRALASLEKVSALPETALLIGSHGGELRLDDPSDSAALSDHERQRLAELHDLLTGIAEPIDQVWVEHKPAGFALHTRLATEANSRVAQRAAREKTAALLPGLTVRDGKNVLEFSVRSTNKGEAIDHLREYTAATAVFFAGDDVTDEDAFAALGASDLGLNDLGLNDLGLKVGDGQTLAGHRVAGPAQLAQALHLLADLREGRARE